MATTISSAGITFTDNTTANTAAIGYNSWTNPTRAINTTYTNSSTKPLIFWATMSTGATNSSFDAKVNGTTIARVACNSSATQVNQTGVLIIVPPGGTYSLTVVAASPSSSYWTESL